MADLNALQWSGEPGHYEVYYLTFTDPASGWGIWIRYTMLAPLPGVGEGATCSVWLAAMHPDGHAEGRKLSMPIERLSARSDPFALELGDAVLTNQGMTGSVGEGSAAARAGSAAGVGSTGGAPVGEGSAGWELRWEPGAKGYRHVHPMLQRARVAKTVLVLPHPDLRIDGRVSFGGRELELHGAPGAQAHLWGSKHASCWTWAHCNDFTGEDGSPRAGSFIDGVSVFVPRLGREVGPSTPIVGRLLDEDFCSTSPVRVMSATSRFGLTGWHFEARAGHRRVIGDVDARRSCLVGVTYHDPDGEIAYCYNSEVATMRVRVWDRVRRGQAWTLRDTLVALNRAHFEYAQREQLTSLPLHVSS